VLIFARITVIEDLKMNSDDFYHHLNTQLEQVLKGYQTLNTEAKMHLKAAITSAFDKLDLVTTEEFDAQKAVLARSREKIDQLELQLKNLEQLVKK
jgi:BMFP domain-containing protein YqiC